MKPRWFLRGLSLFRLTLKSVAESQRQWKQVWASHTCILVYHHIHISTHLRQSTCVSKIVPKETQQKISLGHPKSLITSYRNKKQGRETSTAFQNHIWLASTLPFYHLSWVTLYYAIWKMLLLSKVFTSRMRQELSPLHCTIWFSNYHFHCVLERDGDILGWAVTKLALDQVSRTCNSANLGSIISDFRASTSWVSIIY